MKKYEIKEELIFWCYTTICILKIELNSHKLDGGSEIGAVKDTFY
jgi:hypothetical protein